MPLSLTVIIVGAVLSFAAYQIWNEWFRLPARSGPAMAGVASPVLLYRGAEYCGRLVSDGTAVWMLGGPSQQIAADQAALAGRLGARLEGSLLEAAAQTLATHEAWFEEHPMSASQLAAELTLDQLRVPPDVRHATLYCSHPLFSGHILEVGLTRVGAVNYVGLLG